MKPIRSGVIVDYPASYKVIDAVLCLVITSLYFLPLTGVKGNQEGWLLLYVVLTISLIFVVCLFYRSFNKYILFRDGIEIYRLFVKPRYLPWELITRVEPGILISSLYVSSDVQKIDIQVDSENDHYEMFLQDLINFRPDLFTSNHPLIFPISPLFWFFGLAYTGGLLYIGLSGGFTEKGGFPLMLLCVVCLLMIATLLIFMPNSMTIDDDHLVIKYLFRNDVYHSQDISQIYRVGPDYFTNLTNSVVIRTKKAQTIHLTFISTGTMYLLACLVVWIRKHRNENEDLQSRD